MGTSTTRLNTVVADPTLEEWQDTYATLHSWLQIAARPSRAGSDGEPMAAGQTVYYARGFTKSTIP